MPFLFTERPDALAAIGEMLADGQMLLAGAVREEGAGRQCRRALLQFRRRDRRQRRDRRRRRQGASRAVRRIFAVRGRACPVRHRAARRRADELLGRQPSAIRSICRAARCVRCPSSATKSSSPTWWQLTQRQPTLIVNVTNDAWFGDTPGPYQHFRQAQVRAVENGLPLLRAANNGISGVVDARGRIVDALALNVSGVIDVEIRLSPDALGAVSSASSSADRPSILAVFRGICIFSERETTAAGELTASILEIHSGPCPSVRSW